MKIRSFKKIVQTAKMAGDWIIVYFKDRIRGLDHMESPSNNINLDNDLISMRCPCDNVELVTDINNVRAFSRIPLRLAPHTNIETSFETYRSLVASEYCNLNVSFKCKEALVEALKEIYKEVEVYERGDERALVGYQGDKRAQKAEIIIRRKYVGGASNDIGFYWDTAAGCYKAWVSAYDKNRFNANQTTLDNLYAKHTIGYVAAQNRYYAKVEVENKNEIVVKVTI